MASESIDKNIGNDNFIGKVIDNNDPDCSGRCRVRVFGLFDGLSDDELPWCYPMNMTTFSSNTGAGNLSVPKIGAYVRVRSANTDVYSFEYYAIQNIDPYIVDKIKDDYIGTHVICADAEQDFIVLYQPLSGFTINYKDKFINIGTDNKITLSTQDDRAIVSMEGSDITVTAASTVKISGTTKVEVTADSVQLNANRVDIGKYPNVSAVNGEALVSVLTQIINNVSAINNNMPVPNPATLGPRILSNTVKITK